MKIFECLVGQVCYTPLQVLFWLFFLLSIIGVCILLSVPIYKERIKGDKK